MEEYHVDLVVLARYMQVLSNDLATRLEGMAINIHHSFLPGFKGAKPYHQAHARGVKLIGATAHYVTAELDEGPIIDQDVIRVDHSQGVDQLVALGRDIERMVLARAVAYWSEDRIVRVGHKTIVFNWSSPGVEHCSPDQRRVSTPVLVARPKPEGSQSVRSLPWSVRVVGRMLGDVGLGRLGFESAVVGNAPVAPVTPADAATSSRKT